MGGDMLVTPVVSGPGLLAQDLWPGGGRVLRGGRGSAPASKTERRLPWAV